MRRILECAHEVSKMRPFRVIKSFLLLTVIPVQKLPFALLECASVASKTFHGTIRICSIASCRMTKEMSSAASYVFSYSNHYLLMLAVGAHQKHSLILNCIVMLIAFDGRFL